MDPSAEGVGVGPWAVGRGGRGGRGGAMGKKGKAKKEAEPSEPPHDPGWERAVEARRWDRPLDALPDPAVWPTWGALRERILSSCNEIRVRCPPLPPPPRGSSRGFWFQG